MSIGYWFHLIKMFAEKILFGKQVKTDTKTWLTSAVWTGVMERFVAARYISPRADVGIIIFPGMSVSNWGQDGLSDFMNQQMHAHYSGNLAAQLKNCHKLWYFFWKVLKINFAEQDRSHAFKARLFQFWSMSKRKHFFSRSEAVPGFV